jgi:CheY-like chemotaxis protein
VKAALTLLADGIVPTLIVILSDINMPGMDGLQLLTEVKQRFPSLRLMMVTAYGDDERRQRGQQLGAFEFLTKPVDFEHFKATPRLAQRGGWSDSGWQERPRSTSRRSCE